MPTNYKWNPGHYIFTTPNTGIDEVLPQIADINNLLGVQIRLEWKRFEPTFGNFTAAPILELLDKCNAQAVPAGQPKKRLRILMTYKSFGANSFATPEYIHNMEEAKVDDGAPLTYTDTGTGAVRNVFGVYDYGVGWHPKFYNPWIRDRFIALFQYLGPILNNHPLLEDILLNETAFGGAQVPINGLNWNNPDGLQRFRERATAHANALFSIMMAAKAAFPNTMVGQFVNFPNTGKFSIIKDPTNPATTPGWPAGTALPPKMALNGLTLGGPDSWLGDTSADNGPFQMYKAYRNVIPLAPSVQNANYSYLNHADQTSDTGTPSITIQQLYYKATTHPTDPSVVTLHGNHVAWAAADYAATGHTKTSWEEVKDFFRDKWNSGPDAGNRSPGVNTAIPATLDSPTPSTPPKPVLSLVVDSGVSSTDKVTNNGTVGVDRGGITGGRVEFSTKAAGPWSETRPALVQGTNTWFARQFSSAGMVSDVSDALTFEFCNTIPQLRYITVRDLYAIVGFTHPINLTNSPRPGFSAFTFKVNGVTKTTLTGTFVNEDQQRMRIDWTGALTGSETCTMSYAVPSDDTKFQDVAGNLIAAFTDAPTINLIGLPELTTSASISSVAGKMAGGATNDTTPLVVGTISAPLSHATMSVEIQRQKDSGAFRTVGYATVTGTDWTWQETAALADALYTYRARVQHGDLNSTAGFSALFSVSVDTLEPSAPTITSVEVSAGNAFTLRGTWGNGAGETLAVGIATLGTFTTANGLVISGINWSISVPPLPVGLYSVGASVTDSAGNVAFNETPAEIVVTPTFGAASVILRFCARRPI